MIQFSLRDFLRDGPTPSGTEAPQIYSDELDERTMDRKGLTEEEIQGFVDLFGEDTRPFILDPHAHLGADCGWMAYLLFVDYPPYCQYTGGQDWLVSRKVIRESILRSLKERKQMEFTLYDLAKTIRTSGQEFSLEQREAFVELVDDGYFEYEARSFVQDFTRYASIEDEWQEDFVFSDAPPYCRYVGQEDLKKRRIRDLIQRSCQRGCFTLEQLMSGRICDPVEGWVDFKPQLSENQVQEFLDVFGRRAHQHTKSALARFIQNPAAPGYPRYGIYGRVQFQSYPPYCQYVVGQNYPTELAYVRRLIVRNA